MSEPVVRYNGYQKLKECWHCGNEVLYTYKTFGHCWETYGCEICSKHSRIDVLKRQLYLDLRNMTYTDKGWVVADSEDIAAINRRLRKTMWFAVKELGYSLATRVLSKCTKDYWNEVKGYWVHGHLSGVSCQPPRSRQFP